MTGLSSFIEKIKRADWISEIKKRRYTFASLVIGAAYLYASFLAFSFVVTSTRSAFVIDEQAAQSRVVTFDIPSYEKIKHRLSIESRN